MTDRVFEDERSFEVFGGRREIEVYVDDNVMITVREDNGWEPQRASFTMTAEEATMLKEFLIRKGY